MARIESTAALLVQSHTPAETGLSKQSVLSLSLQTVVVQLPVVLQLPSRHRSRPASHVASARHSNTFGAQVPSEQFTSPKSQPVTGSVMQTPVVAAQLPSPHKTGEFSSQTGAGQSLALARQLLSTRHLTSPTRHSLNAPPLALM